MKYLSVMDQAAILRKMQEDWDARARENARHYVANSQTEWTDREFFASGEKEVRGRDPERHGQHLPGAWILRTMRVLEIGCGAGRVTRALSNIFGEVHAVDVSRGDGPAGARGAEGPAKRARLPEQRQRDLDVLPQGLEFDFAFSSIVFQHIPSREVIENYVREVHQRLRPGALFKFQVQGDTRIETQPDDTWLGRSVFGSTGGRDGAAVRLRPAIPARGRRAVLLALVFQEVGGSSGSRGPFRAFCARRASQYFFIRSDTSFRSSASIDFRPRRFAGAFLVFSASPFSRKAMTWSSRFLSSWSSRIALNRSTGPIPF